MRDIGNLFVNEITHLNRVSEYRLLACQSSLVAEVQ